MARRTDIPPRYKALLNGEITVEDLDEEELRRGQLRDKNGNFSGRAPNVLPREFVDAMVKELTERTMGRINRLVGVSVDVLVEIANNKRAPAVARNQAAIYLMERAIGKVPDKVQQEVVLRKFENDLEDITEDD